MVRDGDVAWAGAATRVAKNIGVARGPTSRRSSTTPTPQTAVLRNQVIGTQPFDIRARPDPAAASRRWATWSPTRCATSTPGVDAALTNSGGLRPTCSAARRAAGEQPCEITWGEMFAVLPFGNRTVIETLTGAQLRAAFINGFPPVCNPASSAPGASRRSRG